MTPDEMSAAAAFLAAEGQEKGEEGDGKTSEASRKAGEKIVTSRCTTCHLFRGEGDDNDQGLAPELSGFGSVAWVRAQITNPATKATYRSKAVDAPKNKGHMPAFAEELSPADIDLLARWTRARARGIPMAQAFAAETRAVPSDIPRK
jgi:mono/diheme cytochrome c family protein